MSPEQQINGVAASAAQANAALLSRLDPSHEWGSEAEVNLYLDRCQVDTPDLLVQRVWKEVLIRRLEPGKVVDFGAGDGRFAQFGRFNRYVGVEIDGERCSVAAFPKNARLIHSCAFSVDICDADVCIGNPPYVRNQDLPVGWRQTAGTILKERSGVVLSGLANAWQYFFLLSITSAKADGLIALVIPYEWVSRPSASAIRTFIQENKWNVDVYRLLDSSFSRVLTTSSITIVDKASRDGRWRYFEQQVDGSFKTLPGVTNAKSGLVAYYKRGRTPETAITVRRGLSPGTQKVLTLTDGERVRLGLQVDRDVVPCVTTLRYLPSGALKLDKEVFNRYYVRPGKKC